MGGSPIFFYNSANNNNIATKFSNRQTTNCSIRDKMMYINVRFVIKRVKKN